MARSPQLQKYLNGLVGDSAMGGGGGIGGGPAQGGGQLMETLRAIMDRAENSKFNGSGNDPGMFNPFNGGGSNYPIAPSLPQFNQSPPSFDVMPQLPPMQSPISAAINYQDSPVNTMRQQGGGGAVAAAAQMNNPMTQLARMAQTYQNMSAMNSLRSSINPTTNVGNPRSSAQSMISALAAALNRK